MDTRYLAYAMADPDFYDQQWQTSKDRPGTLGPFDVPRGWSTSTNGPWRLYRSPRLLPDTGWKIHVSCLPAGCGRVVADVVQLCMQHEITCKHLLNRALVAGTQAKYADPSSAGKVVTAYPPDDESLEILLAALRALLAGEPGARILSDVPVTGTPIGLRYGAFVGVPRLAPTGRLTVGRREGAVIVADDRSPHAANPTHEAVTPAVVADLIEQARTRDAAAVLPVTQVRILHRSNGGGVYAATWSDGRRVVLKEARHHTGFDRGECDASTRLRHEFRALQRLSGSGLAPEPLQFLTVGDSDFLVMEFIDGTSAGSVLATRHPDVAPGGEPASYTAWVAQVVGRTRATLAAVHNRGVTHLDVHPANVIDRDDRAVLIDFESCAIDGVAVARGVASQLSHTGGDTSTAADLASLERMRALLTNPLYVLTARRPDIADEILAAGGRDGQAGSLALDLAARDGLSDRLVDGIHVAATVDRSDRMFPGDIEGLLSPGAGLGLLYGATGVFAALRANAAPIPQVWADDFVDRAADAPHLGPGLGDGAAGTALGLASLGAVDEALALMRRATAMAAVTTAPWWGTGRAGYALAAAELSARTGSESLLAEAVRSGTALGDLITSQVTAPGWRAGLINGWSGVCLALLRVAEVAQQGGRSPTEVSRLRQDALLALERELPAVHEWSGAVMTKDGMRVMPYLGTGSAALGIAADACRAQGLTSAQVDLQRLAEQVCAAATLPAVISVGLMHGRTGLLLTLARLAPDSPAIAMHRRRLGWYTLPANQSARHGHPLAAHADFVLGEQNLRCSADLATGSAGVLLAAAPHTVAGLRRGLDAVLILPAGCADVGGQRK